MKHINGDLLKLALEGKFDIIMHGCNCFCTMGSGIAKQIKEQFPEAYEADLKTKKGNILKLGNFTIAEVKREYTFKIINCYIQYRYGREQVQVDYEALTLCMRKINSLYSNKRIGLPLIGAGLAGGDWNKIEKIIETEFLNNNVTVVHLVN